MSVKHEIGYNLNIFLWFCIIGIAVVFSAPKQIVWGYTWIIFSLIGMLTMIWALISPDMMNKSFMSVIYSSFTHSLPVVIIIILLSWVISMRLHYAYNFNNGTIPKMYYNYLHIANILLIFEILAVYNLTKNKFSSESAPAFASGMMNSIKKGVDKQQGGILYLLIAINFILVSIMNTILKYYMTDG